MKATMRSVPPQGHRSGSSSKTLRIKSAHRRRNACFEAGLWVGSCSGVSIGEQSPGSLATSDVVLERRCVVAVIEQRMSPRLWDLRDDACQELERVDCFEPREKLARVVVRGFGSVENMSSGFGPLQTGKAHGGSKHVASDFFESVLFARGDPHGIVDGEATSLP